MLAQGAAAAAPHSAIVELVYPTDAELQERVKVFARIEEDKNLDLRGKNRQHRKTSKKYHGKKIEQNKHHHHEKQNELADQQELQSPEETLAILYDLATGSELDEEEDVEYDESEYTDNNEEDGFAGEGDEFADSLKALKNGGKI
ncbi:hypothetical protein BG015_008165 [Linnemannia schmuckeri]|uniref:Uncharacterized protein n=1 Tax=Linnemannia schmuckeri TaxID=64567 RepID=A0A9P5RZX2_9FUNG|nr:hypothetical protein BG015_008165 [Linnemannia schmuckeri]